MNPLRFSLILLGSLVLSACATQIPKDTASPYYQVPAGSLVRINRVIEIPPQRTRLFIQHGRLSAGFDHYTPNCNIEVFKRDDFAVQYVEPGGYRITRVQRSQVEVVQAEPLQLAALDSPLLLALEGGDGNASIYEGYHLWLEGPDPNVMRLSCRGAYADPSEAYPPSIDQIRQALGGLITLELAAE